MLMSRVQIAPSLKGELMDLQQGSAFARVRAHCARTRTRSAWGSRAGTCARAHTRETCQTRPPPTLPHASAVQRCIIRGSSDYAVSANSTLVIITAGARQREGESRLDLVGRNLEIFKSIVPQVVKHSPDCVIMVVSNPVDVMTHITQRLSGFPVGRVFGSGTALDSSRFRTLVAEKLGVDTRSVHGMIVGEHGDSSVACWSALTVGGVRMRDLSPVLGRDDDPDNWSKLHKDVINSAYEIIKSTCTLARACALTLARMHASSLPCELPRHNAGVHAPATSVACFPSRVQARVTPIGPSA
ncbi:hypothetical protein EON62_05495 [archaeon]|nr:MAG: hypothetical protein EON62_05495 [archaeon]